MTPIRIALGQIRVEPGRPDENLRRAEDAIRDAAAARAGVIVLPEALDVGWTDPESFSLAQPIPGGGPYRRLCDAARVGGIHVAAGLTERDGGKIYNAAVLISPAGALLLHHRKIHELAIGHATYVPGDRLGVVDLPFGRVGLMICADGFAPGESISRTLGLMGAELILSPCAWAVPSDHDPVSDPYGSLWEDCHGRVAREFGLTIAAASCVGPIRGGAWAGRKCIGCSLVSGPDGATLLKGPYGEHAEALLFLDLPTRTAGRRPGP